MTALVRLGAIALAVLAMAPEGAEAAFKVPPTRVEASPAAGATLPANPVLWLRATGLFRTTFDVEAFDQTGRQVPITRKRVCADVDQSLHCASLVAFDKKTAGPMIVRTRLPDKGWVQHDYIVDPSLVVKRSMTLSRCEAMAISNNYTKADQRGHKTWLGFDSAGPPPVALLRVYQDENGNGAELFEPPGDHEVLFHLTGALQVAAYPVWLDGSIGPAWVGTIDGPVGPWKAPVPYEGMSPNYGSWEGPLESVRCVGTQRSVQSLR